ncbi:MAG: TIGR02221 family CRISPR-associated protein [Candidatus Parabeggiatoa sp.]|nr:TIGR02221 family CRISPR-associated protein [Candidatus Parabeggiatoa sp.]
MSHILITFLGKSEKDNDIYPPERYHFEDDDTKYYETSFFGLAVLEHLAEKNRKPDKLVVLGTSGSMWDAFFQLSDKLDEYEDDYYDLAEIIENNSQYQEQTDVSSYLKTAETILKEQLKDAVDCELRLIPYGEKQDDQILILKEMADCVAKNDTVSLDITHGLRHLPMLTVLSAMYLEVVKKVTINGIYYGARDMKHLHDKVVPAVNLGGLLQIAKWVGALNSFDKDGDYAVFAKLLEDDGLSSVQTHSLKEAAFFERNFNISDAARKLANVYPFVQQGLKGIGKLFSQSLLNRMKWHKMGADSENNPYHRQRDLAKFYLENRDYPRAVVFAFEAMITKRMTRDFFNYSAREAAKNSFESTQYAQRDPNYNQLKELRNVIAHGSISDNEGVGQEKERIQKLVRGWTKDEELLQKELKRLMKVLLL